MPAPIPGLVGESLRRSTVAVRSGGQRYGGAGSGVFLKDDLVITNAHVIQGDTLELESWDGHAVRGRILRMDRGRDLALLSAKKLRAEPAQLGDSAAAPPGTAVVAIGNPLGFTGAMSSGIVHASYVGRGYRWLCADIHLAPGNSGGPLATHTGLVIGINTMVISGGLALAVPSRSVQAFLNGRGNRRPLGFTLRPVTGGILILEMLPNGPAEQASLRPGDLLVGVNGQPLRLIEELQDAANESETLTLEFRRGGETQPRKVVLQVPRRGDARAA